MKYILDGYNVIHKVPHLARYLSQDLQEAREGLVRFMAEWRQSRNAEVVIIFDRRKGALVGVPVRSVRKVNGIACVFSAPGAEADDEIIAMLKREKNPERVTVISDDGKILNHCKALKVNTAHPSFLDRASSPRTKNPVHAKDPKSLSPARESDITLWYKEQLKEREDLA